MMLSSNTAYLLFYLALCCAIHGCDVKYKYVVSRGAWNTQVNETTSAKTLTPLAIGLIIGSMVVGAIIGAVGYRWYLVARKNTPRQPLYDVIT